MALVSTAFIGAALVAVLDACLRSLGPLLYALLSAYLLNDLLHHARPLPLLGARRDARHENRGATIRQNLPQAGEDHANSACLEGAAESLADSFISPLLWYLLLGLPGAWLQRLVNTLEGLVAFRKKGRLDAPRRI